MSAAEPDDRAGDSDGTRFSFRTGGDGRVLISWSGRVVTTLRGDEAAKFLARVSDEGDEAAQLVMAKATGNFKRGNERR